MIGREWTREKHAQAERRELAAEMAIRAIEDTPPPYHAVWPTYDDGSDHDPKGGA